MLDTARPLRLRDNIFATVRHGQFLEQMSTAERLLVMIMRMILSSLPRLVNPFVQGSHLGRLKLSAVVYIKMVHHLMRRHAQIKLRVARFHPYRKLVDVDKTIIVRIQACLE